MKRARTSPGSPPRTFTAAPRRPLTAERDSPAPTPHSAPATPCRGRWARVRVSPTPRSRGRAWPANTASDDSRPDSYGPPDRPAGRPSRRPGRAVAPDRTFLAPAPRGGDASPQTHGRCDTAASARKSAETRRAIVEAMRSGGRRGHPVTDIQEGRVDADATRLAFHVKRTRCSPPACRHRRRRRPAGSCALASSPPQPMRTRDDTPAAPEHARSDGSPREIQHAPTRRASITAAAVRRRAGSQRPGGTRRVRVRQSPRPHGHSHRCSCRTRRREPWTGGQEATPPHRPPRATSPGSPRSRLPRTRFKHPVEDRTTLP